MADIYEAAVTYFSDPQHDVRNAVHWERFLKANDIPIPDVQKIRANNLRLVLDKTDQDIRWPKKYYPSYEENEAYQKIQIARVLGTLVDHPKVSKSDIQKKAVTAASELRDVANYFNTYNVTEPTLRGLDRHYTSTGVSDFFVHKVMSRAEKTSGFIDRPDRIAGALAENKVVLDPLQFDKLVTNYFEQAQSGKPYDLSAGLVAALGKDKFGVRADTSTQWQDPDSTYVPPVPIPDAPKAETAAIEPPSETKLAPVIVNGIPTPIKILNAPPPKVVEATPAGIDTVKPPPPPVAPAASIVAAEKKPEAAATVSSKPANYVAPTAAPVKPDEPPVEKPAPVAAADEAVPEPVITAAPEKKDVPATSNNSLQKPPRGDLRKQLEYVKPSYVPLPPNGVPGGTKGAQKLQKSTQQASRIAEKTDKDGRGFQDENAAAILSVAGVSAAGLIETIRKNKFEIQDNDELATVNGGALQLHDLRDPKKLKELLKQKPEMIHTYLKTIGMRVPKNADDLQDVHYDLAVKGIKLTISNADSLIATNINREAKLAKSDPSMALSEFKKIKSSGTLQDYYDFISLGVDAVGKEPASNDKPPSLDKPTQAKKAPAPRTQVLQ